VVVKRGKTGTQSPVYRDVLPDPSITLEQVNFTFEKKMQAWKRSSCRRTLLAMLEKARDDSGWRLEKALCLGSGGFARRNFTSNQRSLMQLVCFVDIVENLGAGTASAPVQLLAQDPAYLQIDKDFLHSKGVTVLDLDANDHGSLEAAKPHIGPTTMVFEPFMGLDGMAFKDAFEVETAVYIGTSWSRLCADRNDEIKDFAERFYREHENRWFPRFEEDTNVFEGLWVHWRLPQELDSNN